MIFVIDDDEIMAECIALAIDEHEVKIFNNAIEVMNMISEGEIPEMIFLDILLTGPDGFTLLNELISYDDTAKIPVVIVTSLNLEKADLSVYGVVGILEKDKMLPSEIKDYVRQYAK